MKRQPLYSGPKCPVCHSPVRWDQCDVVKAEDPEGTPLLHGRRPEECSLADRVPDLRPFLSHSPRFRCPMPNCKGIFPPDAPIVPTLYIGMGGGTGVGKSHENGARFAELLTLAPEAKTALGLQNAFIPPQGQQIFNSTYYLPFIINGEVLGKTRTAEQERPRALMVTLVFDPTNRWHGPARINVVIFDMSGEDMHQRDRLDHRRLAFLQHSHALIYLIDPTSMAAVWRNTSHPIWQVEKRGAFMPNLFPLTNLVDKLREKKGLSGSNDPLPLPCAAVLSKSDLLRYLVPITADHLLMRNHDYRGGYRPEDFRDVHHFVRKTIVQFDLASTASTIESSFTSYHYFATSAAGCSAVNGKFPLVQPIRVLDPLIWLLAALDLIPEASSHQSQQRRGSFAWR